MVNIDLEGDDKRTMSREEVGFDNLETIDLDVSLDFAQALSVMDSTPIQLPTLGPPSSTPNGRKPQG